MHKNLGVKSKNDSYIFTVQLMLSWRHIFHRAPLFYNTASGSEGKALI